MVPPRIIQATVVQMKIKLMAAMRLTINPPDTEYFIMQSYLRQQQFWLRHLTQQQCSRSLTVGRLPRDDCLWADGGGYEEGNCSVPHGGGSDPGSGGEVHDRSEGQRDLLRSDRH